MTKLCLAIGFRLTNTLPQSTSCGHGACCVDKGREGYSATHRCLRVRSLYSSGQKKALRTKKSTGQHTSKAFKASRRHESLSILCLFRLCIKNRIVFTSWKTARLTPEHKKDDETSCSNFRAISLLNVPSKILE